MFYIYFDNFKNNEILKLEMWKNIKDLIVSIKLKTLSNTKILVTMRYLLKSKCFLNYKFSFLLDIKSQKIDWSNQVIGFYEFTKYK